MSESKFTPGPWKASEPQENFGGDCFVYGADQHSIARVWVPVRDGRDLREATARLIAAAPDLYVQSGACVALFESLYRFLHQAYEAAPGDATEGSHKEELKFYRDQVYGRWQQTKSVLSKASQQTVSPQANGQQNEGAES